MEFVYAFRFFRVCLVKLGVLMLGVHRLIIVISFWCIFPFINIECPFLSHLVNVSLKSTLSEINIATPGCLQLPLSCCIFFQPFILFQCGGLLWTADCWIFIFNPDCQSVSFDGGIKSINY
jgi:hypothetical protein